MSKYRFAENDIYLPGTDIPRNRLGIETQDVLHEVETTLLQQATDGTVEKFAERLAHFQSELIALHPFHELNGRITRLFFDLITVYNGYPPDIQHARAGVS
ncbi:MAG: hypothetical protein EPO42_03625 [Gallionellaceae bacterium]|nr:MAG: hypothetical protein EPO42_03625 [Gallionellaceae bacterium]